MAMEYYSGFDPEEAVPPASPTLPVQSGQYADAETSGPAAGPRLEQDITEYSELYQQLLATHNEGTVPPPNTTCSRTVRKDPFTLDHMQYQMLKRYGYGVHFVDDAEKMFRYGSADSLSVYVDDPDYPAVSGFMNWQTAFGRAEALPEDGPPIFHRFIHRVAEVGVQAWVLDPHDARSADTIRTFLLSPEERATIPDVLERGFMTAQVIDGIKIRLRPSQQWRLPEAERRKYEQLRAEGTRPFSIEQLYGLAGIALAYALDADKYPDFTIPPPASRQTQEHEY